MVWTFPGKVSENPKILKCPKGKPFNRKFWKLCYDGIKMFYLARLSSFPQLVEMSFLVVRMVKSGPLRKPIRILNHFLSDIKIVYISMLYGVSVYWRLIAMDKNQNERVTLVTIAYDWRFHIQFETLAVTGRRSGRFQCPTNQYFYRNPRV